MISFTISTPAAPMFFAVKLEQKWVKKDVYRLNTGIAPAKTAVKRNCHIYPFGKCDNIFIDIYVSIGEKIQFIRV